MDPTKDQSDLDLTEDPNCHVHFVAADLPEPLPKLDLIERRYSARPNKHIKVLQLSNTSKYMVKRSRAGLMEGWTMRYLEKMTSIPVPTVYAILTNKKAGRDIIVMEYIPDLSLEETWSTLEVAEKEDTAKQLAAYLTELRALQPPGFFGRWLPAEFGNLDKEPLPDFLFTPQGEAEGFGGPFDTVEQLARGLGECMRHNTGVDPERREFYTRIIPMILTTESPPVLTHGDLQLRNLIRKKNGQVVIIDWGLCGWYPEFWEYCYTVFGADFKKDWPTYIPKFLSEYPKELCPTLILRIMWYGSVIWLQGLTAAGRRCLSGGGAGKKLPPP